VSAKAWPEEAISSITPTHEDEIVRSLRALCESSAVTSETLVELLLRVAKAEREAKDLHDLVRHLHARLARSDERIDALETAIALRLQRGIA
jgi:hypothetical protein